jgi:hypothetical protein
LFCYKFWSLWNQNGYPSSSVYHSSNIPEISSNRSSSVSISVILPNKLQTCTRAGLVCFPAVSWVGQADPIIPIKVEVDIYSRRKLEQHCRFPSSGLGIFQHENITFFVVTSCMQLLDTSARSAIVSMPFVHSNILFHFIAAANFHIII